MFSFETILIVRAQKFEINIVCILNFKFKGNYIFMEFCYVCVGFRKGFGSVYNNADCIIWEEDLSEDSLSKKSWFLQPRHAVDSPLQERRGACELPVKFFSNTSTHLSHFQSPLVVH
jgi:hypothetical protein